MESCHVHPSLRSFVHSSILVHSYPPLFAQGDKRTEVVPERGNQLLGRTFQFSVFILASDGHGLCVRRRRSRRSRLDVVAAPAAAVVRAARAAGAVARGVVFALHDDAVALVVVAVDEQREEEG